MELIIIFAWIIAMCSIISVLYYWIFPYIRMKWWAWRTYRMLKKISDKHPDSKHLKQVANTAKKFYKETTIDDV